MRVLLTGATGFIGRHVLDALQQRGIDTLTLGRHRPPGDGGFIQADLLHDDLALRLKGCEASHLLHLAWYTEPGQFWHSPLNTDWQRASQRLAQAFIAQGGQHLVAAGSCAEYDWSLGLCCEDETALNPASLYGQAKNATRLQYETLCHRHQVRLAWGRVFFPYGQGEPVGKLLPSVRDALLGQRPAFAINTEARRDYIHVSDVAAAFLTLLTSPAQGAYNIGSGQPVRLAELIKHMAEELNQDPFPLLNLSVDRQDEPPLITADINKLTKLSWCCHTPLEKGIRAFKLKNLNPHIN
ncbi:NAD(P)-dependent oxidoreductase [Oceanisphaera sediminis]|uniref:NAD(P)-dependent oxidoreductase n=1 Tax=Oceanisphaera sediminis TaxID=981381 RepID=A0ABP7E7S7_9GAMM